MTRCTVKALPFPRRVRYCSTNVETSENCGDLKGVEDVLWMSGRAQEHQDLLHETQRDDVPVVLHQDVRDMRRSARMAQSCCIKTCCIKTSCNVRRDETCCTKVSWPDVECIRMTVHKAYVKTRRTKMSSRKMTQ